MAGVTTPGITYNIPETGNLSAAIAILDQYCTQLGNGSWQVDSAPFGLSNYVLGYSPLINITTGLPVQWTGAVAATIMNIMCQDGWGDVAGQMQAASIIFSTQLHIPVTTRTEVFYNPFAADVLSNNVSMALGGLGGPKLLNAPLVFLSGFVGTHTGWGSNTSGWTGPAATSFVAKFKAFEVAVPGSANQLALASDMQLLLAQDIPSIPFVANGYWYAYNTKNFVGWASAANEFQQICASWDTQPEALKCRVVLNLVSTTIVPVNPGIAAFPVFFVLLAAAAPVVVLMARYRKNVSA
jgi:hypothetical protein